MKSKRKGIILIIVMALVFLPLIGCSGAAGGNSQSSSGAAVSNSQSPSGDAHVKISVYGVPNDWRDAGNALEQAFMSKYPNIEIEDIPYVADSLTFIKTRASANDLPDITEINNDDAGIKIAQDGKMMDLKDLECVKHIFAKIKADYTLPNGMVYGLTQGFSTSFIYYNKDIFKNAGISNLPASFDEFMNVCKTLSDKGITPIAIPAVDPASCGFPLDWAAANILGEKMGLGNYEKSLQDGTLDLTTADGLKAVQRVADLSKYFQKGCTSMNETAVCDMLTQGKAAMAFCGSWDAAPASQGGNIGVFFPPFNDPGKELWLETSSESAIGASTTHMSPEAVDAKKKMLEFWFSPEGYQLEQNARGNIPAIDNAVNVKILPDIANLVPVMGRSKSFTMDYAVYSSQAFETFVSGLQEVYIGATTPEQFATKITDAVKKYPKKVN